MILSLAFQTQVSTFFLLDSHLLDLRLCENTQRTQLDLGGRGAARVEDSLNVIACQLVGHRVRVELEEKKKGRKVVQFKVTGLAAA